MPDKISIPMTHPQGVATSTHFPWACLQCRAPLDAFYGCDACGASVPSLPDGRPDFRITGTVTLSHSWSYDPEFGRFPWEIARLSWPDEGHEVRGDASWKKVERTMIRSVPQASARNGGPPLALDIGCGADRQRFRDGLLALGYQAVGLDIGGPAPDALADAHRLPLLDASVDLVITHAVWEHLKHPHVAMAEVARVMKPGARLVGLIAFGEPFHVSYFHHSPLATYELVTGSGLDVESIIISDSYSALYAHLDMGAAGQRVPRVLHRLLAESARWLYVLPGALRGRKRLDHARLAFARSHSASVGVIATRR